MKFDIGERVWVHSGNKNAGKLLGLITGAEKVDSPIYGAGSPKTYDVLISPGFYDIPVEQWGTYTVPAWCLFKVQEP